MDERLQRRVQRYGWDKASGLYEASWQAQLAPAQDLLLKMAAVQPGEKVVETACGTGLVTIPIARAVGPSGLVEATDLAGRMIDILDERCAEAGVADRVNGTRMDAEKLDFDDATFDVAVCALGLMYAPDPRKAVEEMYRVLKAGGRAVAAVWGERRNCGWEGVFHVVDSRVNTEVCPMFFLLGGEGTLARDFERAGFTDIREERISTTLEYANDEEALVAAFAGGPVAMAYDRFDEATRDSAHDEYLGTIASYCHGEGYRVPGEFVVVAGVRP
jgi:ubiquinone/menaquinone biosynthesis C-methylase UbiE